MKVLFVINQLESGGAEQQLIALCEGLCRRGHETEVISIYSRLDLRDRLDKIDVPITVVHKYWKTDLTLVWRLRRLIMRINPELVHAYLPAACLFTALTKWLGVGVPLIQAERLVNNWRSGWRIVLDNLARKRVDLITCNAEAIRTYLIEVEHVLPEKTALIYNGLVPARRTRPDEVSIEAARRDIGAPEGACIVICVANFFPDKQHQILLEAFSRAREEVPELFLVLVGQGPLDRKIRRSIRQMGLDGVSRIITDRLDPLPLLCATDVAALTSSREGCSNALMEAMAMGLPVVASEAGGNGELVVDGQGGVVCRVWEISAFAKALVELAQNPSLRYRMGLYNLHRSKEFTDDVMVEETLRVYERVLSGRARERR
jgi:glycosyltransferase involved in cell wall biosynthesis